jgi:hypothetical protein
MQNPLIPVVGASNPQVDNMERIVTSPDGKEYVVNAPEGATDDQVIAYAQSQFSQPAPQPAATQPQHDYMTRDELMTGNPIEDAAIGLGRFATEVGQGAKQKFKMAFGEEGEAEAYTEQINADTRRYDAGTEGAGMEDVGYYGGMMAPGLATGGLGIPATAGMAAVEAGILPTQEASWADTAKQAATGAAFAGVLRAAPDLWAAQKAIRNRISAGKIDQDVLKLAEQYGVKVPRSVHSPNKSGKVSEELGNLPVIGRLGAKKMREDSEKVLREIGENNQTGQTAQEAFVQGKKGLEEADRMSWSDAHSKIGDSPIDREAMNNAVEDVLESLDSDIIGKDEAKAIQKLWSDVRETPWKDVSVQRFKQDADNVRGFAGDTLQDLHQFRAKFGSAQQAAWAEKGWSTAAPKRVYKLLTEEMQDAASRAYGNRGVRILDDAIAGTKKMHRTVDNTGVMNKARNDLVDRDSSFINAALGGDKDKMTAMKAIIGESGAPTIRAEIAERVLNTHTAKGSKAAAALIKKLGPSIKQFFGPDDVAALKGLSKFMDNIPNEKQGTWNTMLRGAGLGAGVVMSVPGTAAALTATSRWLKRQDVTAMLQKLETTPKDSKLYNALTSELMDSVYVATGVNQSREPMEVDIQNGRPQ